jgi:hypothetical protein
MGKVQNMILKKHSKTLNSNSTYHVHILSLAKNNNIKNLVQTRAIVNAKKELRTVVTSKTNSMRVINFDGISKNKGFAP